MSQNAAQINPNLEPNERSDEDAGVPMWLILLLGILVYLGLSYLDRHGGWFDSGVFEPYRTHQELLDAQPHNPELDYYNLGMATFNASCALCHQPNGQGKADQFPPLAGSDWINAAGPNRIGRIVLNGLSGPIRVETPNGIVSLNASMAPLGSTYDDEHLAAALSYVRKQWGNNASKITPDDIKKIRAEIATHPGPFAPDDLKNIPIADAPK